MSDEQIRTEGGASVGGGVDTGGGDFVGRDKRIQAGTYIERATIITQAAEAEPQSQAPAEGDPPYKGLLYFDVADAGLFFGRELLVAQLVGRLKEGRFLAVVGASGSGKSSVARAGLVPALHAGEPMADGNLPPQGSGRWSVHVITPGSKPLESLAASLTRQVESVTATATLIDDLRADPRSLHLYVRKLLASSPGCGGSERLFLLVDQFEELFTLCRQEDERQAFIDNLLTAVSDESLGPALVVITLRADFYHRCASYQNLRLALERCQAYIGAMSQDELRRAIEAPAERGGWTLEPGLVELMLRDAGAEPGTLPLLSHALLETWKRRQGRMMTLSGYQAAGGVHGAIAQTAESVYRELSAENQAIAKNIFLRLTELGEGSQDTRRRAALEELIPAAEKRAAVEDVLKVLADTRLITTHEDCAEVAHEALIREWPALREWLEQDRESLRLHRHLGEAAQSWERAGRDAGDLYRGARLVGALEWAREHEGQMSALEDEFLRTSKREGQREARARRLRWAGIAGLVALLALVVVLAASGRLNRLIYSPLLHPPVEAGDWRLIPAGEFLMGSPQTDEMVDDGEQPQHAVYLDEFEIMAYEVTNAQYAQCVRAGECVAPGSDDYRLASLAQHPVVSVSWYQAQEFCDWAGGRLPSEAEWEKAARGGLESAQYPWGDEAPVCDLGAPNGAQFDECDGDTVAVGSFSPNGYGLFDMAGNVWEWVLDWYAEEYYASSPSANPQGPPSGEYRVLRGGSGLDYVFYLRSASRYGDDPSVWYYNFGFRCARSP